MTFGFDPFAFGLAFLISIIAITEFRRNHTVALRIKDVATSGVQTIDENSRQYFSELRILIQNIGISLHDVNVALSFQSPGGTGVITTPLQRFGPYSKLPIDCKGEFAKGMLADFRFKSYLMRPDEKQILSLLKNPIKQDATLLIFAQGYLVKQFRIGTGRDLIAKRWNEFTWRINAMFDKHVTPAGSKKTILVTGKVLPKMPAIGREVEIFLRGIASEVHT
jgi:hypothetical protein